MIHELSWLRMRGTGHAAVGCLYNLFFMNHSGIILRKILFNPITSKMKRKYGFQILFYEGYKSQETPKAVQIGGKEFRINKILSRCRSFDSSSKKYCEIFHCLLEGDPVKITFHESGEWDLLFLDD